MTPALTVGESVLLGDDSPEGRVVAVLNYGHLVTVQWLGGGTTTEKAENIRRAS